MAYSSDRSMEEKEWNLILQRILDIGEQLLKNGAEIYRVEDTIQRLCRAYGFGRTDVFAITESIIVTAVIPDGTALTLTRRIYGVQTDLGKVEEMNKVSRALCKDPIPPEEIKKMTEKTNLQKSKPVYVILLAYAGISAAFSAFFGGIPVDSAASAISGMFLFLCLELTRRVRLNSIVQSALCSALTGAAVICLVRFGIGANPDKIMIGNIMLVIPGIQFTTAFRDMINGDLISGGLSVCEALLKASAVAIGFAFTLSIMV